MVTIVVTSRGTVAYECVAKLFVIRGKLINTTSSPHPDLLLWKSKALQMALARFRSGHLRVLCKVWNQNSCNFLGSIDFVKRHQEEFNIEKKDNDQATSESIEVYVGVTFQDGNRFNTCQVIYSQFGLAIHQNDHQARRRFVEWAQNEIAVVPDFHKRILFSDEAHFWLNGYVNKQIAAFGVKLIHKCHNVTVNGDRYRAMITNFFIPELNNHDVQELWFQQDGATCHTARATIDLLKDTFGDRLISRFGPVNWPPRSCDLTPLDYFLWGYVKSLVYADKPQTLAHLEDNIRRLIADIRPQMLEKVIENWTSRLDYIRASRGSPMPEIIFEM
ncbi:putative transposable element [Trichonephila clavipes]|nr:putative transposable element [Trichonephila clavipes]